MTNERRGEIALAVFRDQMRREARIPSAQDLSRKLGAFVKEHPEFTKEEVVTFFQEVYQQMLDETFGEKVDVSPGAFEFRA